MFFGEMKYFIKILILMLVLSVFSGASEAKETKIIVAPVNIQTVNSATGLFPDISNTVANDIINELNKNLLFIVPDIHSAENLLISTGLWKEYKSFLGNYKDKGIIDYKFCELLKKRAGVDKILLVSSGYSMQSLLLKQSMLYKIGLVDVNPVDSFYRLDVQLKLVDTQSGLEELAKSYNKKIKVKNFETPSVSLNDNVISSNEIRKFSKKIAQQTVEQVLIQSYYSAFKNVNSDVVMPSNNEFPVYSTDGEVMTRDGRPLSSGNKPTQINRENSFKNWIKENIAF